MEEVYKQLAGLSPEKRELLKLLLEEDGVRLSASVIVPLDRSRGRFPLSFPQQRLWFLEQLEPGSPVYTIPCVLRIRGSLDVPTLERSLNEIGRRHEILRTTFASENDQPIQVIHPQLSLSLPLVDLQGVEESRRETEALRLILEGIRTPFDLVRGPLLRPTLIRMEPEHHLFLLPMHHSVSDGWSTGILLHEVKTLYEALQAGKPSPLPALRIQYADFAAWQREYIAGEVLDAHLAYWRKQLEGCTQVLDLVTDYPRPAVQTVNGTFRLFEWPVSLSVRLNEIARQEQATLFMVLVALLETLLYRYTSQVDINIGTPIANRNRAETETLIGFFVNTLVLRGNLAGNPEFRELVRRTRETTLGAYAHQDLPFELLVENLKPRRSLSHTPLFQVMFVLNNAPIESLELSGMTLSPVDVDSGTSKFDLVLSMMEGERGLQGKMEFNTDLFAVDSIERMLGQLRLVAEAVAGDPGDTA